MRKRLLRSVYPQILAQSTGSWKNLDMLDLHLSILLTGRRISKLLSPTYNAALLMFQRDSNLNLYNLLNTVIPACFLVGRASPTSASA